MFCSQVQIFVTKRHNFILLTKLDWKGDHWVKMKIYHIQFIGFKLSSFICPFTPSLCLSSSLSANTIPDKVLFRTNLFWQTQKRQSKSVEGGIRVTARWRELCKIVNRKGAPVYACFFMRHSKWTESNNLDANPVFFTILALPGIKKRNVRETLLN